MAADFKPFGIEYSWADGRYTLTVYARTEREALDRLRAAAARGRCYTPQGIAAAIPAVPGAGLMVRLMCRLKNALAGLRSQNPSGPKNRT